MNIWFTADTHYNHANVIDFSERPFTDLQDMTDRLVANWNERIENGDVVYHLGDFAFSWGPKHGPLINDILERLNGQKFLIVGNHDRKEVTSNPNWVGVHRMHEIKVDRGGEHKQRIVLCHYPIRSWNQIHRGAWMLHGHCHGNLPDKGGKILDVGVDCFNYTPVHIDRIEEIMRHRPIRTEDHHHNREDEE